MRFDWSSLSFTAVDANNVNREYEQRVTRIGTNQAVSIDLKPAQKIDVFYVITVPAKGVVPKLIVQHYSGGPVLRYDLRKAVKGLSAPFGDITDATGATALKEINGEAGKYYPTLNHNVKLVSTAYVNTALGEHELEEGKKFLVATVQFKNMWPVELQYDWATFEPSLVTSDGEKVEYNQQMLKTTKNETTSGQLKPGEEYTVRFFFPIDKELSAKTFRIAEPESRAYLFDVSGTK
jgi:hypothetical protein